MVGWTDKTLHPPVRPHRLPELADDGSVKVGKVDIDSNPETASAYGVMSIPTVLIFKGGEVVGALVGVQPKQAYEEPLDKLMVS